MGNQGLENLSTPLVSIVILNYNGLGYLDTCLKSVFSTNYPSYEVIFVDNASTDGSAEFVKSHFPRAIVVENRFNLGFAEGNNVGMRKARGEYVVLLNNDTEVDAEWISELVKVAESDQKIGALACKVLYMGDRCTINSAGGLMDVYGLTTNRGVGEVSKFGDPYESVEEVFFAYGAAMMLRKGVLKETGLFDPRYFINHEDTDLCWRIRLKGYGVKFVPTSVVYHDVGAYMKKKKLFGRFLTERNRLMSLLKNYSSGSLIRVLPSYFTLKLCQVIIYAIRGDLVAQVLIKALWWNLVNLPETWRKRKRIQKLIRRTFDESIMKLLVKNSIELMSFLKRETIWIFE